MSEDELKFEMTEHEWLSWGGGKKEQGDLGQARESFDFRPVLSGWGSLGLVEVKWRRHT